MIITVVISMLIVMSYHFFIVGCSKFQKNKRPAAPTSQMTVPATNVLAKTPPNAGIESRQHTIVDRDDGDSIRTKAGNKKKGSKEPDSTDDAFKDLAARLAKKEKDDKTADSLFGDDDENPIAAFQMPERPVVDAKQDGAAFANIVEMEKKPVTSKPKKTPAGSTPVGPPATAKDRSVMEEPAKSRMSGKKSVKKASKISRREEVVSTDKTQSEPRVKVHGEVVEKTQMGTLDDMDVTKTQDARTTGSSSVRNKKKDVKPKP